MRRISLIGQKMKEAFLPSTVCTLALARLALLRLLLSLPMKSLTAIRMHRRLTTMMVSSKRGLRVPGAAVAVASAAVSAVVSVVASEVAIAVASEVEIAEASAAASAAGSEVGVADADAPIKKASQETGEAGTTSEVADEVGAVAEALTVIVVVSFV